MTSRSLSALALLASLALLPGAAIAQPPDDDLGPPRGGPPMMRGGGPDGGDAPGLVIPLLLRGADLSAAQREQVKTLMRANRAQLETLLGQLRGANDALADRLIGTAPVDAAALQPDVERVAQARQALMRHGLETALALRAILTPEQLATVQAKRTRLHDLRKQMRELMAEP